MYASNVVLYFEEFLCNVIPQTTPHADTSSDTSSDLIDISIEVLGFWRSALSHFFREQC